MQTERTTTAERTDAKTSSKLLLLVEADDAERERVRTWLEADGYGVIECPGPQRRDFICLGVRGQRCGLVEIADLAILDAGTLLDAPDHTATSALLHVYLSSDKPVLVLTESMDSPLSYAADRVAVTSRGSRASLLQAVRELLVLDSLAS